jgi:hypothetical protein
MCPPFIHIKPPLFPCHFSSPYTVFTALTLTHTRTFTQHNTHPNIHIYNTTHIPTYTSTTSTTKHYHAPPPPPQHSPRTEAFGYIFLCIVFMIAAAFTVIQIGEFISVIINPAYSVFTKLGAVTVVAAPVGYFVWFLCWPEVEGEEGVGWG